MCDFNFFCLVLVHFGFWFGSILDYFWFFFYLYLGSISDEFLVSMILFSLLCFFFFWSMSGLFACFCVFLLLYSLFHSFFLFCLTFSLFSLFFCSFFFSLTLFVSSFLFVRIRGRPLCSVIVWSRGRKRVNREVCDGELFFFVFLGFLFIYFVFWFVIPLFRFSISFISIYFFLYNLNCFFFYVFRSLVKLYVE